MTNRYTKLSINLKNKKIRDFVLIHLVPKAHVIVETFRPGVMERFGLAPLSVHRRNPNIVYVRIAGYGQDTSNPMIGEAGRDLNYIAYAGILQKFRRNYASTDIPFPGNFLTY